MNRVLPGLTLDAYLVISNFDHARTGSAEGEYEITKNTLCPGGWSGTVRLVQTLDAYSLRPDGPGMTEAVTHERDEQEWTVVGTRVEPFEGGPAGFETEIIDTSWRGSVTVDHSTIYEDADCRWVSTERGSGDASSSTPFTVFTGVPGIYTLQPTEPAFEYTIPITFDNDPCNGPSSSIEGRDANIEGVLYFVTIPGLAALTEDPERPGRFVGSETYLHDVHELPGGEQVFDITASWDLTRTPLE